MRTIPVRELRNSYAQVLRDVQAGETFTVTSEGRPVASLTPYVAPDGPREWVPVEQVIGALAHLGPLDGEDLRRELDEHFVTEVEDPFERWEVQRAEREGPQAR